MLAMVSNAKLKKFVDSDNEVVGLKALETAYKLHNKLQSSTNINIDKSSKSVNIGITAEQAPQIAQSIAAAVKSLKSMNTRLESDDYKDMGEIIDV